MHTIMPGTQDSLLSIWVMTGRELIRQCEHLNAVAVCKGRCDKGAPLVGPPRI
jgi:hypothetical protein